MLFRLKELQQLTVRMFYEISNRQANKHFTKIRDGKGLGQKFSLLCFRVENKVLRMKSAFKVKKIDDWSHEFEESISSK